MTILKIINDNKSMAYYFVCKAGMINIQIINSNNEKANNT